MTTEFQRAQAYQILALNEEMFKKGHISCKNMILPAVYRQKS